MLLLRRLRPAVSARPIPNGQGSAREATRESIRLLWFVASSAARRFEASVARYAERVISAARADALLLPKLMRERNISGSDVAFGVLAVMTLGVFWLFVALLLSA